MQSFGLGRARRCMTPPVPGCASGRALPESGWGGTRSSGARKETMRARKRQRLEKAGWKLGSAKEFLGLTGEEGAVIDLKRALARALKGERAKRRSRRASWVGCSGRAAAR